MWRFAVNTRLGSHFTSNIADRILAGVAGVAWVVVVVYLLVTGKREKRGMDRFFFAPDGFGQCAALQESNVETPMFRSWSRTHAVRLERRSPRWHRLRIGSAISPDADLHTIYFDALVRCDESQAAQVAHALRQRIAAAPPDRHPQT